MVMEIKITYVFPYKRFIAFLNNFYIIDSSSNTAQ